MEIDLLMTLMSFQNTLLENVSVYFCLYE